MEKKEKLRKSLGKALFPEMAFLHSQREWQSAMKEQRRQRETHQTAPQPQKRVSRVC